VLAEAGLDAHDISYVEMHGTGTQAGDAIEMSSVTNVFAPSHRQRNTMLNLGAIKANIGHGEAASGFSGLVKVLMMLQKNAIPANVGIKSGIINRTFPKDMERRKVNIPREKTPWPRPQGKKRRILVNNFSAAGGNTAIIVEDSNLRQLCPTATDPRKTHIIAVSAKSIASLKRNIHKLASHVDDMLLKGDLSSLSYTTTARRIHHPYRVAFSISDIQKVSTALEAQVKDTYSPCPMVPTKVMFTFTGQGSHYSSLGKELYTDLPSFKTDVDRLDNLASLQGFPSFLPLITSNTELQSLSPVIIQLGISCIQVALARMWQSWGITPCGVIGHSLGEYAALHVAGVISASDMIMLVGRRAQLFESHCMKNSHAMVAIKASVDSVRTSLKIDQCTFSIFFSPSVVRTIKIPSFSFETLSRIITIL
jgi:acyl transferase domain-containing protein